MIQLAKIDAALRKDAEAHRLIKHSFLFGADTGEFPADKAACESVGRCANGALLFHSAFPLKQLIEVERGGFTPAAYRFLRREYGLLPLHCIAILSINDETHDSQNNGKRYEEVMALVTFADVMQRQGLRFVDEYALLAEYNGDIGD